MQEYLDRRYALALYEVSEEKGKAEEYLDELSEVIQIMQGNEEFLQIVKHPHLSTSKKKDMFESIFKGRISDDVLSFILILIEKNRILNLSGILDEMKKIHLDKNKKVIAYVKTVVPLMENEKAALKEKLEKKYNRTIILNEEIDKEIIGGVFVRVGNDVIDGTLKTRFDEIRKLTLKTE